MYNYYLNYKTFEKRKFQESSSKVANYRISGRGKEILISITVSRAFTHRVTVVRLATKNGDTVSA